MTSKQSKLVTKPWDSAKYLKNEEEIQAYLEAAIEESAEDPEFFMHALGVAARARSMTKLAREAGISREGLYSALSGTGNPTYNTLTKVAGVFGYRMAWERIEPATKPKKKTAVLRDAPDKAKRADKMVKKAAAVPALNKRKKEPEKVEQRRAVA